MTGRPVLSALAVAVLPLLASAGHASAADLVLHNGVIHTMDGGATTAQAIAITGRHIEAIGNNEDVLPLATQGTEVIDLGGRAVVPGLIDSHLHLLSGALNAPAVQLLSARSIADVQRLLAERAATTPPGEWIVASSGWHESLLAEGRLPVRQELDEAAPNNPVFIPRGGHVGTVNTMGLERAGITDETPDPSGGIIVRDPANGSATGVLLETAAYFARRVLPPPPSPEVRLDLMADMMAELNRNGIVAVVEPGIDETGIGLYEELRSQGRMTVRTDVLYRARTKEEVQKGLTFASLEGDDWLRFAGIKYPLDGGVEGGRLYEPYRIVPGEQPDPEYRGVLLLPPGGEDEYVESLKLVADAGLQAQSHAVGDETIDVITRAYARVNDETPIRPLRWTIMHLFLPTESALETMADIGIIATMQDHPLMLGHNARRWWGEERAAYAVPIRTVLDAGIHVGGGTDAPVLPVSPFLSMWWMTTRGTLNGYVLGPNEAISAREALTSYTIANAFIMGAETTRGSLEEGKLADVAVLSQDILAIEPDEIRNVTAVMTIVDGRIVHRDGL